MAMATATAISGRVAGEASAILAPSASFLPAPLRCAPCSKKGEYALICLSAIFTLMCYVYLLTDTGHSVQTHFCAFPRGAPSNLMLKPGRLCLERQICLLQRSSTTSALSRGDFSPVTQDVEGFLHSVVNMGFLDRLKLAWKIIFPAPTIHENTNASIAKQRLKMILFSDRCEVSDEAKKKIVENVVEALSEFVEIESRDSVQVDISTDAGLGTVYSVTVPVRRVKPEYQESEEQYRGKIVGVDFKDTGESSGNVDVTFDFYVPSENP